MGMTMTQKILAAHAGLERVKAGDLIEAKLDIVLGNDVTTPVAIDVFEKAGFERVFDPEKIVITLDHYTPCKDIKSAQLCKRARDFARIQGVTHFYDVGAVGIEHALLPEQGIVGPGDCVVGADSHTCTYGALGAFSTGVGSTDMAAGMAAGENWFRVPSAIRVILKGKLQPHVSGKDVILHLIGMIGVDGALYKSLEFAGEGVASLSMDDRFTIANMAIEAGGKNGIFPVDERTLEYVRDRFHRPVKVYEADPDAEYEREIVIDLDRLRPTVALPHSEAVPTDAFPICGRLRKSSKDGMWPRAFAASSYPQHSVFICNAWRRGWPRCSSRPAAPSPHRPAGPAWVATWAVWPRESGLWRPPIATLWDAWGM